VARLLTIVSSFGNSLNLVLPHGEIGGKPNDCGFLFLLLHRHIVFLYLFPHDFVKKNLFGANLQFVFINWKAPIS
jgi:hypothetical protein